MGSLFPHLRELLEEASEGLPATSPKYMFGCDAMFAGGKIYALVWRTGQVAVKLTDPMAYGEAMALEGASPWSPGRSAMSGWVLLPEDFNDDLEGLREWVRRAHGYAYALSRIPEKPKRSASKPAKKSAERTGRDRAPGAKAKAGGRVSAAKTPRRKASPAPRARGGSRSGTTRTRKRTR